MVTKDVDAEHRKMEGVYCFTVKKGASPRFLVIGIGIQFTLSSEVTWKKPKIQFPIFYRVIL